MELIVILAFLFVFGFFGILIEIAHKKKSNNNDEKSFVGIKLAGDYYSIDAIIKILFSVFLVFCSLFFFYKNLVGYIFIKSFYYFFPFLSTFLLSSEKYYDNKNKVEIPASRLKKIIKFPFVDGFVNSFVWLLLFCIVFLCFLYLGFGLPGRCQVREGLFVLNDAEKFIGSYYILIGFMLNMFSWCFLGRLISDLFFNRKETNDKKAYKSEKIILFLIISTAFCRSFLPTEEESLNLLNYFIASMPSYEDYFFFKDYIAFRCNIFFFAVTIIPHIKSMKEQICSYFSYETTGK